MLIGYLKLFVTKSAKIKGIFEGSKPEVSQLYEKFIATNEGAKNLN
ncbi:MAG: hypothetical protein ABI840_03850 [bacterium]